MWRASPSRYGTRVCVVSPCQRDLVWHENICLMFQNANTRKRFLHRDRLSHRSSGCWEFTVYSNWQKQSDHGDQIRSWSGAFDHITWSSSDQISAETIKIWKLISCHSQILKNTWEARFIYLFITIMSVSILYYFFVFFTFSCLTVCGDRKSRTMNHTHKSVHCHVKTSSDTVSKV